MSAASQPLNALPQGHRLQECERGRVLGVGGMTYLGFDHHLDQAVAIKEYLPSDIADRKRRPASQQLRGGVALLTRSTFPFLRLVLALGAACSARCSCPTRAQRAA